MKKQEFLNNLIVNMEKERLRLGLTQAQMAEKLEVSPSGYKKIVAGETNKVDAYLVFRLHQICGRKMCELIGEEDRELGFLRTVQELSITQRKFIRDIVKFEVEFAIEHKVDCEDFVTLIVPTGNEKDGMIWDSASFSKINVADYRSRYGTDIHSAILICSNNLYPAYHKGDILLICQEPPRDGDIGIFINKQDGKAYLRKFCQGNPWELVPVSDFGIPFQIAQDNIEERGKWIIYGRVITKIR